MDFAHLTVRPLVEDALRLDLAAPEVRGIVEQGHGRGVIGWWSGDTRLAEVEYSWTGQALDLRFFAGGQVRFQRIRMRSTKAGFGGERWWFECPLSKTPARVLLLPQGADRWAGRAAHGAVYLSQRHGGSSARALRRIHRLMRQAQALEQRNGVRRVRRARRLQHRAES